MTLLSYQIFKTVAEAGSFHKAADLIGLTPSAISHAVSSMEKELGFSIFTRKKAGVTLTSYGEHLMPYVNAVLNSEESLQQAVAEFNGLKQGTVKVGVFSSVCTSWMPDIIKSFSELYPAIEIEVFQGTYDDVSYWIRNGIVDFGFLSTSSAGDLHIEPFYRDPLLCIVPKDFVKELPGEEMTISEMAKLRFVVQRESTDADIQNYMKQNHLDIQTRYHVVDDLATVVMVAAGLGICITHELVLKSDNHNVVVKELDPPATRTIAVAIPNYREARPIVKQFIEFVKEWTRKE